MLREITSAIMEFTSTLQVVGKGVQEPAQKNVPALEELVQNKAHVKANFDLIKRIVSGSTDDCLYGQQLLKETENAM